MSFVKFKNKLTPMEPHQPVNTLVNLADLPATNSIRWVARQKCQLISAIRCGLLSMHEAAEKYRISEEEIRSWERLIKNYGAAGLRTTKTQVYRLN